MYVSDMIKIAIVDDHPMILRGITTIMDHYSHIQLQACYKNGKELIEGLVVQRPDILLLDLQLPDITGEELAAKVMEDFPGVKIIVLTNFDSAVYAYKMQWVGVHGYLLKTTDEKEMLAAIEQVSEGATYWSNEVKEMIRQHPIKSQKILAAKTALTSREKEVLQLIADGMTDQKISETLFLSLHTIKHYRAALLLKLDVSNAAALVSKALKMGIIH